MNRRQSIRLLLGAAALAVLPVRAHAQQATNRPMRGQEMLTEQERNRFRLDMQDAKTEGQRSRIRNQHQELIQQRAKKRGLQIPPASGRSQGGGMDQSQGQGRGQGMQSSPRKKGRKGKSN